MLRRCGLYFPAYCYAVARGRSVGIYNDWPSALQQVKDFPGAKFRKFPSVRLAQEFLAQNQVANEPWVAPFAKGHQNTTKALSAPVITFCEGFWLVRYSFDERHIPQRAGFRFHNEGPKCEVGRCRPCQYRLPFGVWYTDSENNVTKLPGFTADLLPVIEATAKKSRETATEKLTAASLTGFPLGQNAQALCDQNAPLIWKNVHVEENEELNLFLAHCDFNFRHFVKRAGFRWHAPPSNDSEFQAHLNSNCVFCNTGLSKTKVWYTDRLERAIRLLPGWVPALKKKYASVIANRHESLAIEPAVTSEGKGPAKIPTPAGLKYLPFQSTAIAAICRREGGVLLADEPGLGKTITALGCINLLHQQTLSKTNSMEKTCRRSKRKELRLPILIVCPAHLRLNWRAECQRWLIGEHWNILTVEPGFDPETLKEKFVTSNIVIVGYEMLNKIRKKGTLPELFDVPWNFAIFDECHRLKNARTHRAQAVLKPQETGGGGLVFNAKKVLFLTGTPIPNHPSELFPILSVLDPLKYCSQSEFAHKWQVNKSTGASRDVFEELQELLRCTVMIRRAKEDVLKDLPKKRRQLILLPAKEIKDWTPFEKELERFDTFTTSSCSASHSSATLSEKELADLRCEFESMKEHFFAVSDGSSRSTLVDDAAWSFESWITFQKLQKFRNTTVSWSARKPTAVAKLPSIIQHIGELLGDGVNKMVVFAIHQIVCDTLLQHFKDMHPVMVNGTVSMKQRQEYVEKFQTDPKVRLFIGNIEAAGEGLTLTAASHVIFAELPWVPSALVQAEDRCHRIGQHSSVLVQTLVVEGSLDARIVHVLLKKVEIAERSLNANYIAAK